MSTNPASLEDRVSALEKLASADSIQTNLYSVGPSGQVNAITLPVAGFSSQIQWVRQSDGAVVADIVEQQFGTAPNHQSRLQIASQEPVDTGPNVDVSIAGSISMSNPAVSYGRNLMEVGGSGLFGALAGNLFSDWLLKERMTFTLGTGNPAGFIIDSNFRIYNIGGISITFQNSSINPNPPWDTINGRLTMPISGGVMILSGQQGGVSGASLGSFSAINGGAIVGAGSNAVSNFASSPANSNNVGIAFYRQPTGQVIQWSGWNSSTTPNAYLGMFAVPFDAGAL